MMPSITYTLLTGVLLIRINAPTVYQISYLLMRISAHLSSPLSFMDRTKTQLKYHTLCHLFTGEDESLCAESKLLLTQAQMAYPWKQRATLRGVTMEAVPSSVSMETESYIERRYHESSPF